MEFQRKNEFEFELLVKYNFTNSNEDLDEPVAPNEYPVNYHQYNLTPTKFLGDNSFHEDDSNNLLVFVKEDFSPQDAYYEMQDFEMSGDASLTPKEKDSTEKRSTDIAPPPMIIDSPNVQRPESNGFTPDPKYIDYIRSEVREYGFNKDLGLIGMGFKPNCPAESFIFKIGRVRDACGHIEGEFPPCVTSKPMWYSVLIITTLPSMKMNQIKSSNPEIKLKLRSGRTQFFQKYSCYQNEVRFQVQFTRVKLKSSRKIPFKASKSFCLFILDSAREKILFQSPSSVLVSKRNEVERLWWSQKESVLGRKLGKRKRNVWSAELEESVRVKQKMRLKY